MLKVSGLAKFFATPEGQVRAADDVSFEIEPAQCYALLGPSGCGKTTILRCVAGLEQADRGIIQIDDRVVSDVAGGVFVPVHERPIGMVFQSYAIWPHMDVFDNVAYPLQVQRPRLPAEEIEARTMEVLTLVGMQAMARRPATRLSGGQQQRVALARAIVRKPSLLLLDEPLSNLDARLRDTMRRELSTLIRQIGITALFVTHDQVEALSLADRVAVMNNGRIVQEGTPAEIYRRPKTMFVARFLGAANVLPGRIEAHADAGHAVIALDGSGERIVLATVCGPGEAVDIVLRPEYLALAHDAGSGHPTSMAGTVASVSFQGSNVEYDVEVAGSILLRIQSRGEEEFARGTPVRVVIDAAHAMVFGRTEPVKTLA